MGVLCYPCTTDTGAYNYIQLCQISHLVHILYLEHMQYVHM